MGDQGEEGEDLPTTTPPQVRILLPEQQTLHPPGKESVSSVGSVSGGCIGGPRRPAKGKPKPLFFWSAADVNKWWKKHGGVCYELYGDLLTQHDVGGRTLIRMNDIKLEKMGITDPEHRHELMQHILRLRLKHEMTNLKNLDQRGVGFDLKLPDPRSTVPVDKPEEKSKAEPDSGS